MIFSMNLPVILGLLCNHRSAAITLETFCGIGDTRPATPSIKNPKEFADEVASSSSWITKPSDRRCATAESFARWTASQSVPTTFKLSAYANMIGSGPSSEGQGAPSNTSRPGPKPAPRAAWYEWILCAQYIAHDHPIGVTTNIGNAKPSTLTSPPWWWGTPHSRKHLAGIEGKQKNCWSSSGRGME